MSARPKIRYQAFVETGVTTSGTWQVKRRCEGRRGEERRGKENRSRDNSRVNLPRVTVAQARTRISDKWVPGRYSAASWQYTRDRSAEKDSKSERKKKREKEKIRGCRMQQNLKSFPPPPSNPQGRTGFTSARSKIRIPTVLSIRRGDRSATREEAMRSETRRSGVKRGEARRGKAWRDVAWRGETR